MGDNVKRKILKYSTMNTNRTGRKPKPEDEKVKQKKVYITDKEEKAILKKTKKKSLTEVLKEI